MVKASSTSWGRVPGASEELSPDALGVGAGGGVGVDDEEGVEGVEGGVGVDTVALNASTVDAGLVEVDLGGVEAGICNVEVLGAEVEVGPPPQR